MLGGLWPTCWAWPPCGSAARKGNRWGRCLNSPALAAGWRVGRAVAACGEEGEAGLSGDLRLPASWRCGLPRNCDVVSRRVCAQAEPLCLGLCVLVLRLWRGLCSSPGADTEGSHIRFLINLTSWRKSPPSPCHGELQSQMSPQLYSHAWVCCPHSLHVGSGGACTHSSLAPSCGSEGTCQSSQAPHSTSRLVYCLRF